MNRTKFLAGCVALAAFAPGQSLIVKPYLQLGDDSQTGSRKSVTVVWHVGQGGGPWTLSYRTASGRTAVVYPNQSIVRARGIATHVVEAAKIRDLAPGEAFRYQVLNGSRIAASGMSAAPLDSELRVALIGDCGRNTQGQRDVVKQIAAQRPDMLVVTGDIVYPNGRMSEYRTNLFPILGSVMERTLTVAATGNHDTAYRNLNIYPDGLAYYPYWRQPLNGPAASFGVSGPSKSLDEACDGVRDSRAFFSFDNGPAHWVVLDSNAYVNWKSPVLRAWLDSDLRSTRTAWKFVVFHHPPYHSSKKHQEDTMMRAITDILEANRVDVVFCGHVHNYQRTYPIYKGRIDRTFDGIKNTRASGPIYLVTGAGGAELYDQAMAKNPKSWKPWTANYLSGYSMTLASVSRRTLDIRQIDTRGTVIDRFRIDK